MRKIVKEGSSEIRDDWILIGPCRDMRDCPGVKERSGGPEPCYQSGCHDCGWYEVYEVPEEAETTMPTHLRTQKLFTSFCKGCGPIMEANEAGLCARCEQQGHNQPLFAVCDKCGGLHETHECASRIDPSGTSP